MRRAPLRLKEMRSLLLLSVDTSGKTASCALVRDGLLLGFRTVYTARAHSQILLPMAKQLLTDAGIAAREVDVYAAANGPGSYTGLRIGVAAMQALAFAGDKLCAGISTLEGLAWNLCAREGVICSALSARLDLCYCAFFRSDGQAVTRLTDDAVLPAAEITEQMRAYGEPVMLAGDGADVLRKAGAAFIPAPMHLRDQSACGIAMAAMRQEPVTPDKLTVRYLQAVKIG